MDGFSRRVPRMVKESRRKVRNTVRTRIAKCRPLEFFFNDRE